MEAGADDAGVGKRLSIYIGESDRWMGRPLYAALLETLKREGLAGATVTRAIAGFGAHSRIHTASIEALSTDLPLVVEVVDRPEMIEKALAAVGPMVQEGLITLEEVRIVKYTHRYLHPLPGDRPVGDVMSREVATVTEGTPVADVFELLMGKMFNAVPVIDADRHVVGIISDGNLIERGGAQQRLSVAERLDGPALARQMVEMQRAGKTAHDVMTAPVVTVGQETALAHAVTLMAERGLKRVPVVDSDNRLVGILSRVDVLRTIARAMSSPQERGATPSAARTVAEVMDPDVPTVTIDARLAEIVDKMVSAGLKRVIVVDTQGRVAGIISDGDLVARIKPEARAGLLQALLGRAKAPSLPDATAAELMTLEVLSGRGGTSIVDAIQQMLSQRRKRFVVVDDRGRPIGIVDRQRLLSAAAGA